MTPIALHLAGNVKWASSHLTRLLVLNMDWVCVDRETKPIDTGCHAGVEGNLYWNAQWQCRLGFINVGFYWKNMIIISYKDKTLLSVSYWWYDKLSLMFYSSVLQLFLMFNDCRLRMSSLSAGHREGRGDCHSEAPRDRKELRCDFHAHQLQLLAMHPHTQMLICGAW